MTDEEFLRIRNFLKRKYGIDLSGKKTIMQGRLENYVRTHGFNSYSDFMNSVECDVSGRLEKKLVDLLTTNHTFFMRESEHFDFLKNEILPWLKVKEAKTRDLHIWCGASSSGEEPYTIAMFLIDYFGLEKSRWDTQILATDVSTAILKKAIKGQYTAEQIEPLPEHMKRRFFRKVNGTDEYIVTDELKKEVLFRQFNLMDPFPFKKKMHVVFLRNVLIYFDEPTKKTLLRKIYDCLEPGGYLFLGKTETLDRTEVPFKLVKPSIFRK
ncbi:MAG: protein-glutamate O-methyltransferase CheR [Agathobacter sp.]|nr:protein-glutamate O-methyltransferase CheR [Agathobacter sp.]